MRKQIIQNAAHQVATQLRCVEDSIDAALAQIAQLQADMIEASQAAHTAPGAAQDAFVEVASALQGLIAARGGVANAHSVLKDASTTIPVVREMGFGDVVECPPPEGAQTLRVVA